MSLASVKLSQIFSILCSANKDVESNTISSAYRIHAKCTPFITHPKLVDPSVLLTYPCKLKTKLEKLHHLDGHQQP